MYCIRGGHFIFVTILQTSFDIFGNEATTLGASSVLASYRNDIWRTISIDETLKILNKMSSRKV